MNQQLEATIKKSVNEALVRLAPDLQVSKPGNTYTIHNTPILRQDQES